jgi:hypothetical protein
MKIWIDNTGLHSAARCIERSAKGEIDISGLLQFASHLVFSEQIFLSGFESTHIAAKSKEFCNYIYSCGLNKNDLVILDIPETLLKKTCQNAAENFLKDLQFSFNVKSKKNYSLLSAAKPDFTGKEKHHDETIHEWITSADYETIFNEYKKTAFSDTKQGSAAYMIATCKPLMHMFKKLTTYRHWSPQDTATLLVYMRSALNLQLASDLKSIDYAPAPARARLTEK